MNSRFCGLFYYARYEKEKFVVGSKYYKGMKATVEYVRSRRIVVEHSTLQINYSEPA